MGYKLAGYDVVGGVDIDPEMMAIYRRNHNPRFSYLMGVQEFNQRIISTPDAIPKELHELDILDGSPPCSSFSMAGSREKLWGKEKKFREGQAKQVLDTLFFDFIETANLLRPKIVIAENVKGMLAGNAKGYVKQVMRGFDTAGYDTQLFMLNAAFMGVPQRRERVFFVARRRDLDLPWLHLEFNEPIITAAESIKNLKTKEQFKFLTQETTRLWHLCRMGKGLNTVHAKGSRFNAIKIAPSSPCNTVTSHGEMFHWGEPRHFTGAEFVRFQTFPDDFDFLDKKPKYVCGMSVPPFMMQRIADQICQQMLKPKEMRL